MSNVQPGSLEQFRKRITGTVIVPGEAGYEQDRLPWNLAHEQFPAVIVWPESVTDIVEAIHFAKKHRLGIAVQGTGHGIALPANECMLIKTSRMANISIDPITKTARVQAGALWGDVLKEAQVYGLVPLVGSSPNVGVVGLTLAGGLSWLGRKHGLTTDRVKGFTVVTANGHVRHVCSKENPDLFWALRGAGGGSLAIVTEIEIERLIPIQTVYGGFIAYPASNAAEVFTRYSKWIENLPEEWTTSIAIMHYPPLEDVPEKLRGESVVEIRGCRCGSDDEDELFIQSLRDWKKPTLDTFAKMPFGKVFDISHDPLGPLPCFVGSGDFFEKLSEEMIEKIVRYSVRNGISNEVQSPLLMTEIRYYGGGAISRVSKHENAFSQRGDGANHVMVTVGLAPDPNVYNMLREYDNQFRSELSPHMKGTYLGFMEGDASTRDVFPPEIYDRLVELKDKWDPEDLFCFGFNYRRPQAHRSRI